LKSAIKLPPSATYRVLPERKPKPKGKVYDASKVGKKLVSDTWVNVLLPLFKKIIFSKTYGY
jgi:hypothetical protein